MSFRKALFLFSLIAAAACPAAGYSLAGSWIGAGLAILLPLVLLFPRGFSAIWLPTFFLGGEVFLAAAGLLEGAPDLLMILGAAAALAAWDLAHLDRLLRKSVSSPAAGHMERAHLRCMLLALGVGLLLSASGILLVFRIPFFWLFLLALLDIFSLDRVYRLLTGRSQREG